MEKDVLEIYQILDTPIVSKDCSKNRFDRLTSDFTALKKKIHFLTFILYIAESCLFPDFIPQ